MAAMFEGLKYFREILGKIALRKRKERKCSKDSKSNLQRKGKGAEQDNHGERTPLVDVSTSDMSCMQYLKSLCLPNMSLVEHALHLVQTFLHVVQVAVAYVLMLVVMTYNLWLFFAVVFGFGVGYLIFGRLRMVQGTHMIEEDPCCN
jgi:copper transporter 1